VLGWAAAVALVGAALVRSWARASDWVSDEALNEAALKVLPNGPSFHYSLANGHKAKAERAAAAALTGGGGWGRAATREAELAEGGYREALQLLPTYYEAHSNLGVVRIDNSTLLHRYRPRADHFVGTNIVYTRILPRKIFTFLSLEETLFRHWKKLVSTCMNNLLAPS
jgi:hypothetical protein